MAFSGLSKARRRFPQPKNVPVKTKTAFLKKRLPKGDSEGLRKMDLFTVRYLKEHGALFEDGSADKKKARRLFRLS